MTAASRPSLREPSSGRSEPHPSAAPAHDVRWGASDQGGLRATCRPCLWARTIEDGYTTEQLVRLDAMHCGGEDA